MLCGTKETSVLLNFANALKFQGIAAEKVKICVLEDEYGTESCYRNVDRKSVV